ncbi:MAG: zinc ABC transporter substrate-binding protein [Anaerolineaceae bacterium]|nr:MAG: zinc ABC transporter substrate-binding protein [Anaerolineaceae bacterium]
MFRKLFITLTLLALTACSVPASSSTPGGLPVVATTSLIGDVARQIGGDSVSVSVLLPPGTDPHSYEPRPQDVAILTDADLVLVNGFDLEETLEPLFENAVKVIVVSDGIEALPFEGKHEGEDEHSLDPHVWQDPNNVIVWAHNIADAFAQADPAHAEQYAANAEAYIAELTALDAWIIAQVARIPQANRKIVTDHTAFGYFTARYGFEQVGAVIPSLSSGASPSAQELAALEDAIRSSGVKAIFVGSTVSPDLSRRVADDTGVRLVMLHTGSLSGPGGGAESYLEFMRYNVNAMVEALR